MKQTKSDLIKMVCERILAEHEEIQRFTAGFGPIEPCNCPACKAARELLEKIKK